MTTDFRLGIAGTTRSIDKHLFVAPDNGVLSMIYASAKKVKVRAIVNDSYYLKPVSHTFHGRDIFAPVAAHLAAGVPRARFGKLIEDYCRLDIGKPSRTGKRVWTGMVMKIDRGGTPVASPGHQPPRHGPDPR